MKTEEEHLARLIAFPSVSADKAASTQCARYCADFFKRRGFHSELIESDGYPHVIATSRPTKTPKVLLQCHMDVVPADERLFAMTKSGGKLKGRGAFDMKFACASYMKLADELGESVGKYDFGVMLSFDEEIGGHNGVEALLNKGYGADICILPDSGKNWHLETSAHGAWFIKLTKKGRNAHASMPENGVNAAEILLEAINEIKAFCRRQYSAEELTLSLTCINSGEAVNQIPDHAEAKLDIRFRTAAVRDGLEKGIDRIYRRHEVDVSTMVTAECMDVDHQDPGVIQFVKIAENVLGRKITQGHSLGATDARYFCAKRIPCIVIQPDGGGRHSDDEWVDAQGVKDLTAILKRYLEKCAKT